MRVEETVIPTFADVMVITQEVSAPLALEDDEAHGLYDAIVQTPHNGVLVEVGCQMGRSSSMIIQLQQAIGFHSIHIDPYTSQADWLADWVKLMHRIGGDFTHEFTLLCMRTEQAAWLLPRLGLIDMAYIDGDHERPGVEVDMRLVASRIKPGGLMAAHDYMRDGLPGVRAGVEPVVTSGDWDEVGIYGSLGVWRRT